MGHFFNAAGEGTSDRHGDIARNVGVGELGYPKIIMVLRRINAFHCVSHR